MSTVLSTYLSAYDGDRFVESMRCVRAYAAERPILAELLPHGETPVEIIGGRWDAADRYAEIVTGWWTEGHARP
jgi:hypothetical protein